MVLLFIHADTPTNPQLGSTSPQRNTDRKRINHRESWFLPIYRVQTTKCCGASAPSFLAILGKLLELTRLEKIVWSPPNGPAFAFPLTREAQCSGSQLTNWPVNRFCCNSMVKFLGSGSSCWKERV